MDKKFVNSWNISDFEIETDTGWQNIVALHKTIKYQIYVIYTENNYILKYCIYKVIYPTLSCASGK